MGNVLLVIGNGFDMRCTLKSSYKSFFQHEFKNRKGYKELANVHKLWITNSHDFESSFCHFMNNYKPILFDELTIWDVLFIMRSNRSKVDDKWNQVESAILESIKYNGPRDDSHFCWEILKSIISNEGEFTLSHTREYVSRDDYVFCMLLIIYYDYLETFKICSPNHQIIKSSSYRVSSWERFLLKQLNVFEAHFCLYLESELKSCELFEERAQRLFKTLLGSHRKLYVMSFNYTNYHTQELIGNIENVHGTLDEMNVIFGIDDKELTNDSKYYIFSKTCRKLTQFTERSKTITNVLWRPIAEISFYGHSLSKQDYSYFQSIFDYYDIYASEVKLKFYYYIYDTSNVEKIKADVVNSTIALMKSYGATLDNKDHGANLLHKLIIENRLQIIEI